MSRRELRQCRPTRALLPALALVLSIAQGAAGAVLEFQTPISGDTVAVTVVLTEIEGDTVEIDVSIPTGTGDLLGVFGNLVDGSLAAQLALAGVSADVTQWQFSEDRVSKVGAGNNTLPARNWDWGIRVGQPGSASGAIEQTQFQLSAPGLDIEQLLGAANAGHRLGVRIQSTSGAEGSAKIGLSEDAPWISILVPTEAAFLSATPTAVSGTVAGLAPTVDVNGVVANVAAGAFDALVPLVEGPDTITATASNALGTASDTIDVVLDTIPPVVSIGSPADGTLTESASVVVTGTVTDTDTNPVAEITVAGQAVPVVAGAFSTSIPLVLGDNSIVATAVDPAGNIGSDTVSVFRGEAPGIAIEQPVSGSLLASPLVSVSGTVTGLPEPTVSLDGVAVVVSAGAFSTEVSLGQGPHLLTATATNGLGSASDATSIVVDSIPPVVTIDVPVGGSEFQQTPIDVSGSVLDASAVVALSINGIALAPGAVFATTIALIDGPNTVTVSATDAAGNTGSASVTVTFSDVPPLEITIDTPAEASVFSAGTVAVSGSISDPAAVVSVNGVTATITGSQYVANNVPLVEGPNFLTALGLRGAESVSASVTVEHNLPPEVLITAPTEGAVLVGAVVDVEGVVDDLAALLDVNGVAASVAADGRFTATGVPLLEGPNLLTARAIDLLGATGTASVQVTREDDTPGLMRGGPGRPGALPVLRRRAVLSRGGRRRGRGRVPERPRFAATRHEPLHHGCRSPCDRRPRAPHLRLHRGPG